MKKFKSFTAGLVVGAVVVGSLSAVTASSIRVDAFRTQSKIMLDGKEIIAPYDVAVLNYGDRTYTPSRFVAEALGARVDWDAINNIVKITSPAPITTEVPKEVIKEVIKEVVPEREYQELPIQYSNEDYIVQVYGIDKFSNGTDIMVKLENKSKRDIQIKLVYKDSYIEVDGKKINNSLKEHDWYKYLSRDSSLESILSFDGAVRNTNNVKVIIPISTENYTTGEKTEKNITFYMDITDDDK